MVKMRKKTPDLRAKLVFQEVCSMPGSRMLSGLVPHAPRPYSALNTLGDTTALFVPTSHKKTFKFFCLIKYFLILLMNYGGEFNCFATCYDHPSYFYWITPAK